MVYNITLIIEINTMNHIFISMACGTTNQLLDFIYLFIFKQKLI